MLSYKQIKTMCRPHTNKTMTASKTREGKGWWSDDIILLREDLPEKRSVKCTLETGTAEQLEYVERMGKEATTQVYPTIIEPWYDKKAKVQLTSLTGEYLWVDAKYLGAILKRATKNRNPLPGSVILSMSDKIITARRPHEEKPYAYLMSLNKANVETDSQPDWQLMNHDIPETEEALF